jgi:hypothetical protein
MASDPSLHPIVLQNIYIMNPGHRLTCDQDGLESETHKLSTDVTKYMPPATPVLTRSGTIKVHQPRFIKQPPHGWWKAQCAFRGLDTKGTVGQLQNTLRGHEEEGIADAVKELEERSEEEFRVKNAEEREKNWLSKYAIEDKARIDPKRLLQETFPTKKGAKKTEEALFLETFHFGGLRKAAKELKLVCEYAKQPQEAGDFRVLPQCVAIGRTSGHVTEHIRGIQREAQRIKQREKQDELARKKKLELSAPMAKRGWDVTRTMRD